MSKAGLIRQLTSSRIFLGADRITMLRVYYSHIRSIIDYGSIVYNSAKSKELNRLNVLQNQALRLCTGAFRPSPIVSLHAETDYLTLRNRRKVLSLKYVKLAAYPSATEVYSSFQQTSLHFSIDDRNKKIRKCRAKNSRGKKSNTK